MVKNEELRQKILESTITVFNKKGLKLTMSDIATEISISKKTIYKEFDSKDELFDAMVDYIFDTIKEKENEIANDPNLGTIDRLKALLGAMPDSYQGINFQELHPLKEKYPEVYEKIAMRLETGWETTIELLEQGKKEGVIRKDADIRIIKVMLEASIEKMISEDMLEKNNIKYVDALKEVVNILVDGIAVR
ncbi:transcriptional regulator, TetR family [Ruminococcaceae bacterium KH2T8]|nr:transcriptional regulator, TetR family [Ruminococcaceae bacterium KH2T8]